MRALRHPLRIDQVEVVRLERDSPTFVELGSAQRQLEDLGASHFRIHLRWKVIENDVGIQVHETS